MSERQPRVLIVDDTEDIADLIAIFFRQSGWQAEVRYSGPDALEAARVERFDAVLSDIAMPVMNGYELVRALRALDGYRKVTLIALTGFAMHDDRERSLAAGFDHHLTKPLNPTTFKNFIARLREEL